MPSPRKLGSVYFTIREYAQKALDEGKEIYRNEIAKDLKVSKRKVQIALRGATKYHPNMGDPINIPYEKRFQVGKDIYGPKALDRDLGDKWKEIRDYAIEQIEKGKHITRREIAEKLKVDNWEVNAAIRGATKNFPWMGDPINVPYEEPIIEAIDTRREEWEERFDNDLDYSYTGLPREPEHPLYGEARGSTDWPEEFIDEVLEYARENPRANYRAIANHFGVSYDQFGNSIRGWLIEAGLKRENIHWRKRPEWKDHKKTRAQIQGIDL